MELLEGCIRFWKSILLQNGYLLSPSTTILIENTVKFLEEFKEVKENGKNTL